MYMGSAHSSWRVHIRSLEPSPVFLEEELAKIWKRKKYNTTSSKLQSENQINI